MPHQNRAFCAGLMRAETLSWIGDPRGNLHRAGYVNGTVRGEQWRRMEPLLEASAAEHEQEARIDDGTAGRYHSIRARVLLLGGGKSPAFLAAQLFPALQELVPDASVKILDGLDHFAPDRKAKTHSGR